MPDTLVVGTGSIVVEVGIAYIGDDDELAARVSRLASSGAWIESVQVVTLATAAISGSVDRVEVEHAAAEVTLGLPTLADCPIGRRIVVAKANTGSFGIVFTPDEGSSINDGAVGDPFVMPGSASPCTSSTFDPSCVLVRTGAATWRVRAGS